VLTLICRAVFDFFFHGNNLLTSMIHHTSKNDSPGAQSH
jgi:hypothetical protein